MKVKNISNKVIVIGEEVFLPNDEKEIPASYEDNPVVREYLDRKFMADAGHLPVPASEVQNALQKAQAEVERYRAEAEEARAEAEAARAEAARKTRGRAKKESTAAADPLPSPSTDGISAGEPQAVPSAEEPQAEPEVQTWIS